MREAPGSLKSNLYGICEIRHTNEMHPPNEIFFQSKKSRNLTKNIEKSQATFFQFL